MKGTIVIAAAILLLAGQVSQVMGQSASETLTWTNAGGSVGYCLAVTNITDSFGVPMSGGYVCPQQADSFQPPNPFNVGSLYLGEDIQEGIQFYPGPPTNQTYNTDGTLHTFDILSTFTFGSSTLDGSGNYVTWNGTMTQHYLVTYRRVCNYLGCHKLGSWSVTGGKGTLVAQPY